MRQTRKSRRLYFIGLLCIGAIVGLNHLASAGNPLKKDDAPSSSVRTSQQEAALEAATLAERNKKREQPDFSKDPLGADKYVTTLARRHGANFDTLSDDDKSFLNGMAAGHGAAMLRGRVERLRQQAKSVPKKSVPTGTGKKPGAAGKTRRDSGKEGRTEKSRLSQ